MGKVPRYTPNPQPKSLIASPHSPNTSPQTLHFRPQTTLGHLAHKATPTPPGPPQDPRPRPTVVSRGGAFYYRRGTPVHTKPCTPNPEHRNPPQQPIEPPKCGYLGTQGLRTQGYEDADSLRSLKNIHPGSVDWKLIVNSAVSVNLIERQRSS